MVEKKTDKLWGWELILKEFGYTLNPATGDYENWELGASFNQEMVYRYFEDLDALRENLTRFRDDEDFRDGIKQTARAIAEEVDRRIEEAGGKPSPTLN